MSARHNAHGVLTLPTMGDERHAARMRILAARTRRDSAHAEYVGNPNPTTREAWHAAQTEYRGELDKLRAARAAAAVQPDQEGNHL